MADRAETAGIRRRLFAFLADAVVVGGLATVIGIRRRGGSLSRAVLTAGIVLVGGLVYHILLEGAWGRTVGKAITGIAVVKVDGGPCTYDAATIRTLLRFVDWLPAGYVVGVAAIRLTQREQRLGDLAAGTLVVRSRPSGEGNRR